MSRMRVQKSVSFLLTIGLASLFYSSDSSVPSISFSLPGVPSYYHITKDDMDTITPEIMEDLAQLFFVAILDMADQDEIDFRK